MHRTDAVARAESTSPDTIAIRTEQLLFAACVAAGFIARFSALSLGYAIDDYLLFSSGQTMGVENRAFLFTQGRFGVVALAQVFSWLGFHPPKDYVLGVVLSTLTLAWLAVVAVKVAGLARDRVVSALAALMVVLYPYQVEYFTFRISVLLLSLNFALVAIALKISTPEKRRTALLTSLLIFSASISPLIVMLFVGATLFAAGCRFAISTEPLLKKRALEAMRESMLVPRVMCAGGALILFTVLFLTYLQFEGVRGEDRAQLIAVSELPRRMIQLRDSIAQVLLFSEPVFASGPKRIMLVTFFAAAATALVRVWRDRPAATLPMIISASVFPAAILLAAYIIVVPPKPWWPVPRTLLGVVWFWAFLGVLTVDWLRRYGGPQAGKIGVGVLSVVMLAMVSANNQVLADQLRVDVRDREKVNRIIASIEELPEFPKVSNLAIVGGAWAYLSPISTVQGDLNISALYPSWSKVALVNEVSGYSFVDSVGDPEALKVCERSEKWPAKNSVHVAGSLAIVCLP